MRNSSLLHWANAGFTIGTITFDLDLFLRIGAFLIVTLPLGYVQWVSAVDKWRERRRKRNGKALD